MEYKPTIGLEIHVELKTRTKMFCDCLNDPKERHPNQNVCPICLGHPGVLPTINKEAVRKTILVGLALNCTIAKESFFERKNYFYPDLPKGYQISQFQKPLCENGFLELGSKRIKIRRIHLEEDAGKLLHMANSKEQIAGTEKQFAISHLPSASFVDFNRAGVPLMELVTEPDFESGGEVKEFAEELQLILRYLGVSDVDMEKGQFRIEVNISLGQITNGEWRMGTKTEIKNLNSVKAAVSAISYETKRQGGILKRGENIAQETRGWDDVKQKTVSQRSKEEAHDYRYFPEPDLPSFETEAFGLETLKNSLPELPAAKRQRFGAEYNLNEKQAEILIKEKPLADYFEETVSELKSLIPDTEYLILCNYLTSDLLGLMSADRVGFAELKVKPEHLAHLAALIGEGKITSRQAKDILKKMFESGSDPEEVIKLSGFELISDESLIGEVVQKVIGRNESAVSDYRRGKTQVLQFLLGEAMKELRGNGDPAEIRGAIEKYLRK